MPQTLTFFAPGRVNLIGEHIDYNGGLVLPVGISLGIRLQLTPRPDKCLSFSSATHDYKLVLQPNEGLEYKAEHGWANYPKGMIQAGSLNDNTAAYGWDWQFSSTLPEGAGLSSSAAIEVLTGYALAHLQGAALDKIALALSAKQVENQYIGVNCGIMDQFAIVMAQEGQAIALNCANLDYQYVSADLGDCSLVIMNTNKARTLAGSAYNERLKECARALSALQNVANHPHLCAFTLWHLEQSDLVPSSLEYRRARHAITEAQRVQDSIVALAAKDLVRFGHCLTASHASLRDDYEVSCHELDVIVDAALASGALGARMTGAGFGGCAIALVKTQEVAAFQDKVASLYASQTDYTADFYACQTANGVSLMTND